MNANASPQAVAAVRSIKHGREWGAWATGRYLDRLKAIHHYIVAIRFEVMRRGNRREA